jgi:DNA-binding IclR family transcriptional regulator
VPSTHPVKMAADVGDRTWAHVSALGKVLLAWGGDGLMDEVLREQGLPALTANTLVDEEALVEELARTRDRGYGVDDEESALGLRCVAAPVRNEQDAVIGALSVSAPAERLSLGAAHALVPALREAAGAISARLGWRGGDARDLRVGKGGARESA